MTMGQIIVRYLDLPYEANGFVREDIEGNYNVYVNSRLSFDMQKETIKHELNHVQRGDFNSESDIRDIEDL